METDIITYTLTLRNTGNTPIMNVIVKDTLPMGTTFVEESVIVNGVPNSMGNPETGIIVGTIAATAIARISFKVVVDKNPPNFITNTATADYSYLVNPKQPPKDLEVESNQVSIKTIVEELKLVKSADQATVAVGEVVIYTFEATNIGKINLEEVIIKDLLDPALDFVEGSVTIDGLERPLESILVGVIVGPLFIGEIATITFKARVVQKVRNTIENQGTAVFTFDFSHDEKSLIKQAQSNLVVLNVAEPKLTITKEANKALVSLKDVIGYKITLRNTGDTPLYNVIFRDELSKGAELIAQSVKVNGVTVNDVYLKDGMNIGTIEVRERVDIIYQVQVIAGTCNGFIENRAYATYNYVLVNGKTGEGRTEEVMVATALNITTFKQVSYNKTFKLPKDRPRIEELDDVSAKVQFIDSYVVDTVKSESIERRNLSGKKLIAHGDVEIVVEYTALEETQSMHSVEGRLPMSEIIILPVDYEDGQYIELTGIVEDIQMESIIDTEVEISLMILIVAKVI